MKPGLSNETATRHVPVLVDAVRKAFTMPPGRIIDATAGGGGHLELLLSLGHRVAAVDRDPSAIARLARRFSDPLNSPDSPLALHLMPFSRVSELGPADGLLADLGFSSDQIEDNARGFSFDSDAVPDMRMSATSGTSESMTSEPLTAAELVATSSADELARILVEYGEEKFAGRIARAVAGRRFDSCRALASQVAGAVPAPRRGGPTIHPATRTFQALRIAVNNELGELATMIDGLPDLMKPGAVVAIISFHSLEDRIVKRRFADWTRACRCPPEIPRCVCGGIPRARFLWRGARPADDAEIVANPRARSARIRAVAMRGEDSDGISSADENELLS